MVMASLARVRYQWVVSGLFESVRSGVFFDNPASMRVQAKLGFREIGRRQVECLARGRKVEHIDTVLTRAVFRRLTA